MEEGLIVNRNVALRADALRLRIVVRDLASGAIGSVSIPADRARAAIGK